MSPYFWPGYKQEAAGQEKALHGGLAVTELDAVQVEDALAVGQHQGIQRQDLKHL